MERSSINFQPFSSKRKFQAIFASSNRYFTENSRWVPLNNTLRWSAKDINKIKLPLSTTGGKSSYIITLIRICRPKWRENTSDKVTVRFVTCYFRLAAGNQRAIDLYQFKKAQWQKCRAVSTDALQLLVETYMQISGIAHIPPG